MRAVTVEGVELELFLMPEEVYDKSSMSQVMCRKSPTTVIRHCMSEILSAT